MRRTRSDQGGRWPWGIWLALVGVSAGTVGSFAVVGWAFTSAAGLYDGSGGGAPLEWESETIVIEAEEAPPGGPSDGESPGAAGDSRAEPGPEPSAAEPQVAPAPGRTETEPELRPESDPESDSVTDAEPPQLIPIESGHGRDCESSAPGHSPGGEESLPDWAQDNLPELIPDFE
ncbi:hypothetical protein [Glycomyces buryatensis]|uniref:Uncharacterized protein n=1 Tax=Glycomyces buryatensis TaxID=2570927 RepID=A0A4S8QLG8_9ACTN|nr:hypothetical protein [Glycomyces buryatensis]THV41574.1 hypothetical protein FAB82_10725 [Glycomyces buryatensis]